MKCFYLSQYKYYEPNYKNITFFLLSDIHFSHKVTNTTLDAIVAYAQKLAPNYILIPGDLVDCLDMIDHDAHIERLARWLKKLSNISPVIISLGNHDFYRKTPDFKASPTKHNWIIEKPYRLLDYFEKYPDIHFLDNDAYQDKYVYILGITQSPSYFQIDSHPDNNKKFSSILHPGYEDRDQLIHDIQKIPVKKRQKLPKHLAKIALMHSPVYAQDNDVATELQEFDYVISGHMHNGAVPPIINELWRSDRGLFAPGKKLFPRSTRTTREVAEQKQIICSAVTTIHACSGKVQVLNHAFPVNIATLTLSRDKRFERKPDIRHKYVEYPTPRT